MWQKFISSLNKSECANSIVKGYSHFAGDGG